MERSEEGKRMTRRESLKTAAAFMILPAGLARGYAANEKLNLGIIGLAGQGERDAQALNAMGENIAALCDVDSEMLDMRGPKYPNAKKYTDFRRMIEREKLDGVVVATPDHSHAYISVWAMKHGVHVYCQKPLDPDRARSPSHGPGGRRDEGGHADGDLQHLRSPHDEDGGIHPIGRAGRNHRDTCGDGPPHLAAGIRSSGGRGRRAAHPGLGHVARHRAAPARSRPRYPEGHPVYNPAPEKRHQSDFKDAGLSPVPPVGVVYHPFVWRGWTEFGSGALGDIAPHSMNVLFWALDLGAPSAVEVVETSGMKREMYPDWTIMRFEWAGRGVHPPLKIYWYDGGKRLPARARRRATPGIGSPRRGAGPSKRSRPGGGLIWIGTKGSLPEGRGPFLGQKTEPYPELAPRDWGREEVHKDWVAGGQGGQTAPLPFRLRRAVHGGLPAGQHRPARGPSDRMGSAGVSNHQLPGSEPVSPPRIPARVGPPGNRRPRLQRVAVLKRAAPAGAQTASTLGAQDYPAPPPPGLLALGRHGWLRALISSPRNCNLTDSWIGKYFQTEASQFW